MRVRVLQAILILVLALASFLYPGASYAQTTQIYEYYNTNDDGSQGIYATYWYGQTFNTTSSHSVSSVRLKLYKVGTAGTLSVGIRACNVSTGLPEGVDLTSGVYDGSLLVTNTSGSFREITLTEYTLAPNTQYAIVVMGTGADASNGVFWRSDNTSPTYTTGCYISSINDGITWTANTSRDCMFELYGEPMMQIVGAQVYENYIEDNDWLFVINYIDEVTPYYPASNPKNYWQLQILDGSSVLAAVPAQQWGQRPGSIYLNANSSAALEWEQDYIIRLNSSYGLNLNVSYTLTPSDWVGDSFSQLDTWCINLAHTMEDRDAVDYLTESDNGYVLNTLGGSIFTIGIPYLPETRPGIFQYALSSLEYTDGVWTNAYPNSLPPWDSWMGADITALANSAGAIFHISGKWALGIFLFLVYMVIAGIGIFNGKTTEGLVIGAPLILLAMNWMIIPMALVATFIMIMVYKWLKAEWPERT